MQKREFLTIFEDARKLSNYKKKIVENIKSHNLPVVVFGAAEMAKVVTEELKFFGVDVFGYAVDEEYYQPNQTYLGLPVFNFDVVSRESDKYVFVLGVGAKSGSEVRANKFMNDKNFLHYQILSGEGDFFGYNYILENQDKFFETYNMLSDELSRQTMIAYLITHITDNPTDIANFVQSDEYFNEITRPAVCGGEGSFIDCGAYNGDTVKKFIDFVGGNYKKIFAVEPDPSNFEKLKKFVEENDHKNVECFDCGVWNEQGVLYFSGSRGTTSRISENGSMELTLNTIDNIVGNEKITLIKMDIEGAELNALKGAAQTLERFKPTLAISVYHKKDDLITIPQFIKSIYKDCKFYIRKYDKVHSLWELDLYAVPNKGVLK
ncbi:MAG: FkbM family methyltransferase [Selenomonadaceae bacterium]|nr:FkbM family methyltransferase [Selenomonadaceae bacterium]